MAFNTNSRLVSFHATNTRQTKTRGLGCKKWIYYTTCPRSCTRSTACTKLRTHTQPITHNAIPQKDNMIPYMAQSRHPLNSQVLAIFFPFAIIPATPHYPAFTYRYSPQYGMLTFLLHFMTNTFFSTFLPVSPPAFVSTLLLNHAAGRILCMLPSLTPHTNFSDPTAIFSQPFI